MPDINRDLVPRETTFSPRMGNVYQDVRVTVDRAHLGDFHHHGPPPQERARSAVLDSLKYPGMYNCRDVLTEAYGGTFD